MCLTIPKKVISREGDFFVVESASGVRQKVKSMVSLKTGDYALTQGGICVEKMEKDEALEILKYFKKKRKGEKKP